MIRSIELAMLLAHWWATGFDPRRRMTDREVRMFQAGKLLRPL